MAMPSGNVVIPDKVQFPGVGGGSGEAIHHHQRQWFPDERDGFISWLKGEFAAANAIIDSLCHHLRSIGEPGEYDGVIGTIQQRRCNWNHILHMQHYFSVAEVSYALQHVSWRRQQRFFEPVKSGMGKDFRRSGGLGGGRGPQRADNVKEGQAQNSSADASSNVRAEDNKFRCEVVKSDDKIVAVADERKVQVEKPNVESSTKSSEAERDPINAEEGGSSNMNESSDMLDGSKSLPAQTLNENKNISVIPKTFVGNETFDGKMINVVEGMKLYEELFDDSEVLRMVSLVNDLRTAGRRGQLQGQTYVVSKRHIKGHGREMIQLGVPVVEASLEDEIATGTSKDQKIESIPALLQDVIERLIATQIITVKPDSCVIDIFKEGEHSQPHTWPHWFGRPMSLLFLTECDMTFGKVIGVDHPGDYRGSCKLSLAPGSMLLLQGKSSDFAKHAIPSLRKQRILVTLTKSQPRKNTGGDAQRFPSTAVAPNSHWAPPPSRSPNHVRHSMGPKHYGPVATTGVLPVPAAHPQLTPTGIQPIFVPTPVASAMPFPAPVALPPVSTGWSAAPPRHPPPRLPAPGTGVFLPPGSGNSSTQSSMPTTDGNPVQVTSATSEDNGSVKANGNSSLTNDKESNVQQPECNGNMDGNGAQKAMANSQQQVASEAAGTV